MKPIICSTLAFCILTQYACNSGNSTAKPFPMTVIVSDKLGNSKTGKLPDELTNLCSTLPKTACSKNICYYPEPVIKRIANNKIEMSLKPEINAGFAGDKSNPKVIDRAIVKYLNNVQIGEQFSAANEADVNYVNSIKLYIEQEKNATIFCYSKSSNETTFCGKRVFSDADSLKTAIADALCEHPSTRIIVVYNPPAATAEFVPEKISYLQTANQEAKDNPSEIKQVKSELETFASENPSDYRPLYELAKNSIYGKEEHHVAFSFLFEAVEVAINTGQAQKLKADIGYDLSDKQTLVWKLADHHEWKMAMEALATNDISKLKHHDE